MPDNQQTKVDVIVQKINFKKQELRQIGIELKELAEELDREIWHVDFPGSDHFRDATKMVVVGSEADKQKDEMPEEISEPRHACCGSHSRRHRNNCPKKQNSAPKLSEEDANFDEPVIDDRADVQNQKPERMRLRCGNCEHNFEFRGFLVDAVCPECRSIECYRMPE